MKSICFIPARGGSKGIPKKNIRILGDKPLIANTIESLFMLLKSSELSKLPVETPIRASAPCKASFKVPFLFDLLVTLANWALNSFKSEFSDEINIEAEECTSKYSLEYLQKMIKATKLSEKVSS